MSFKVQSLSMMQAAVLAATCAGCRGGKSSAQYPFGAFKGKQASPPAAPAAPAVVVPPTAAGSQDVATLAGRTFQTACVQDNPADATDAWFKYDTLAFAAGTITRATHKFSASTCDGASRQDTWTDNYLQVQPEIGPDFPGWTTYVYQLGSIEKSMETVYWVDRANDDQQYGYSDWALGVAKDVSGRALNATSQAVGAANKPGKLSFVINGDTVYLATRATGPESAATPSAFTRTP